MPARWFICPDGEQIEIEKCLSPRGCRMDQRCATLPYLQLASRERKWDGVTPSASGNGPRYLYLKAKVFYTINPQNFAWASFGIAVHDKLAIHSYTKNVLSEEKLSDKEMKGIADVLEEDEFVPWGFILTDYKSWGSYKLAKALGIVVEKTEETILDSDGKPVILKTGKNAGKPKTKQKTEIIQDPSKADLRGEELQLNRYRIFYESYGYPISKMQIQAIPRDGNTYIAQNRGIDKNIYIIPVKRLLNNDVLDYYRNLNAAVLEAFKTGYARMCDMWESWERRRCSDYCEVKEACQEMSKKKNEKWGII